MQTVPVTQIANPHQCTKVVRHSYASLTSRVLGTLQIVFGFLLMVLQGVAIGIYAGPYIVGHGFWSGILMIIAGAFGIAAANFRSTCTIVASMVLSIIAASITCIPMVFSIIGITMSHDEDVIDMGRCHTDYYPYHINCPGDYASRVAVNILMLLLCLLEITAAIWTSVLGCKEMCVTRPHVESTQQVAMMAMPNQASQQSTYMVNMPQAQQTTPAFMQQGPPIQNQQTMPVAMQQGIPIQTQQAMPVAMQHGTSIQTQQTTPVAMQQETPIQTQQAPMFMQQGTPMQIQQAMPDAMQQGTPMQIQQAMPVTMQQGTPIQIQQAMPVAMQQGKPIQIQQPPMVMQQGTPVLVPNGQQFIPMMTQQGQLVTPVAMQQGQQATPVAMQEGQRVTAVAMQEGQQFTAVGIKEAVAQGQQAVPVLMPQDQLANVHDQAANTIGNSPFPTNNSTQMAGALEQTTEPELPCD